MKKTFSYLIICMIAGAFTACTKMDHNYSKFIVPGGIVYTQAATDPVAYAGHNRIRISWLRGTDQSVVKARIFWNNYTDSVEVTIPPAGDTISATIDNLPENAYSFMIKTYDAAGHSSVPAEVFGGVYGTNYQSGLLNRPVTTAIIDTAGTVTLQWAAADVSGGAYETEIQYKDTSGNQRTQYVPVSDAASAIPDIMRGTTFQYRTVYLPNPLAIDTFYTPFQETKQYAFDKSSWQVVNFSSQYRVGTNEASWVFNGDPATGWFESPDQVYVFPKYVTIDMGHENIISEFDLCRIKGDQRSYDTFQLLVSNDNVTWTDLGVFDFNRMIDDFQIYNIPSHPQARYFKFIGLTGGPANGYTGLGEITVYGL